MNENDPSVHFSASLNSASGFLANPFSAAINLPNIAIFSYYYCRIFFNKKTESFEGIENVEGFEWFFFRV